MREVADGGAGERGGVETGGLERPAGCARDDEVAVRRPDDAGKVLEDEKGTLGRRDLKRRIEQVSTEVKVGDAVKRAVDAMNAAIMTVVFVPIVVAGGSSG